MRLGLRIDVDTYRGTRDGVPELLRILDERGIRATFFLTVGPDNMGRHLRRLVRPSFLWKMLRSDAAGIYGWDILLRGTLWPGPVIHRALGDRLRAIAEAGHEIGMHAWDHHRWQVAAHRLPADAVRAEIQRAHDAIGESAGVLPTCTAAPGWRCTPELLALREDFGYRYASDCRGRGVFRPPHGPPQIPVNLPTWDEAVGHAGIDDANFNAHVLASMNRDDFDVLTIHAESEGGCKAPLFEDFLDRLDAEGGEACSLGELLPDDPPPGRLRRGSVPGRDGWLAVRDDVVLG
ncbi:MAG: 4-deoxy-4-formamido-L-arabinose-phosphoundecaprenol deformylase [Phycisphaerae bacterium]|nr:4-deoxy-4-formamido-L-arabinose-phosphoundecaprenol deformylase [Phycisphaerae bacterium]